MTDVIVPAHNEAPRIAPVLAAIRGGSFVSQLIVVADCCTDDTAIIAEEFASRVISIPNGDKGSAMAAGLREVGTELVAFIDADIQGLKPGHVDALLSVGPLDGQVVGDRDGYPRILSHLPSISGERRIPTWLARSVHLDGAGWRAETLINVAVAENGLPWEHIRLNGVTNLAKAKWLTDPWAWAKEFGRVIDSTLLYGPELAKYISQPGGATTAPQP